MSGKQPDIIFLPYDMEERAKNKDDMCVFEKIEHIKSVIKGMRLLIEKNSLNFKEKPYDKTC